MRKKNVTHLFGKYFFKAFAAYMMIFIVFAALVSVMVYKVLPEVYKKMRIEAMEEQGKEFRDSIQGDSLDEIKKALREWGKNCEYGIALLSEDEKLLYMAPNVHLEEMPDKPPKQSFVPSNKGKWYGNLEGNIRVDERQFWSCIVEIEAQDGNYLLQLTSPRKPDDDMYRILYDIGKQVLLIGLLFAVFVSFIFAVWMSRPILTVARQARRMIEDTEDTATYKIHTSDEVKILQQDLVQLYGNLQETVRKLKKTNLQLEEQIQVVQNLEKQKGDFFAAASHELKTPIAAASVMLEGMIDRTGIYQDRDRYLRECRRQLSGLSKLVQNILDITKLESIKLSKETVQLESLMASLCDEYDVLADRYMIQIERSWEQELQVETDASVLKQALSNLLSNAVCYSVIEGIVKVRGYREDSRIVIKIWNPTEKPMAEEVLKNYKNAFARPESEKSGSGLGLYIVYQICQILEAEFCIENVSGGVEASIEIPVSGTAA